MVCKTATAYGCKLSEVLKERCLHFLLVASFIFYGVYSQEETATIITQNIIERIMENLGAEETDISPIMDNIYYLMETKPNLNEFSREQLESIKILSNVQVNNLYNHIQRCGELISIHELQSIPGFSVDDILLISSLFTVKQSESARLKNLLPQTRAEYVARLEHKSPLSEGYKDYYKDYYRFLGSPYKIYNRFRVMVGNVISAGFLAEKDAGEKDLFDYTTFHFFYRNPGRGIIRRIALGDYIISFGSGIAVNTGFPVIKMIPITSLINFHTDVSPYMSTEENRFLRGGALSLGFKNLTITPFYSENKTDGRVVFLDSSEAGTPAIVTSLATTGLHRNMKELSYKDNVKIKAYGAMANFYYHTFNFGVLGMRTIFDPPINPFEKLYNVHFFRGNQLDNFSLGLSKTIYYGFFWGEVAISNYKSLAYQAGTLINLGYNSSALILYRNYPPDYFSYFANAISESYAIQNERGFLTGFLVNPLKNVSFEGYLDLFKFPWAKYNVNGPSQGYEILTQLTYNIKKRSYVYLRFKTQTKEVNAPPQNEIGLPILTPEEKSYVRMHLRYQITSNISIDTRAENSFIKNKNLTSNGSLLYCQITYRALFLPFSLWLRYYLFDIPNYDSRIYAYEIAPMYVFKLPSFYYKGNRILGMLSFELSNNLTLWIRVASNFYPERDYVGSNENRIYSKRINEFLFQVRYTTYPFFSKKVKG